MNFSILSMIVVVALASSTVAQSSGPKNEYSVWGGYSPDSTTAIRAFGRTPDTRFGLVALRYARRFNNGSHVNLKYTADLIPVAAMSFPDLSVTPPVRKSTFGIGITPFGVQANFRPAKKYQPFADLSGGFMYFNKMVPNALGTKFHFTAALGGGLEIKTRPDRAFTIGYKYFHISNGQRGQINPGFDNNLFYVGYTFFAN